MASVKNLPEYQIVDGFRLPNCFDPKAYRDTVKYNPRDDDMFIVTYPKCGTTWMQYVAYLLFNDGNEPKDMIEFNRRVPYMEMQGIDAVENMIRPGILKTHLPFSVQPYSPKAKCIYVARNPKDCCVSFYHHTVAHPAYNFEDGDFDAFFAIFLKGETDYGDFFDHHLSWYEHRNDPNVLFVFFEDMKHKPKESVYQVASFLGDVYKERMDKDPSYVDKILHLSSVESMKKSVTSLSVLSTQPGFDTTVLSSGLKYFSEGVKSRISQSGKERQKDYKLIRKGVTGGWKEIFTEEQNKRMDEKMEEKLKGTEMLRFWKDGGFV